MPSYSFKAVALAGALSLGALAASHQPADAGGRHHRHHNGGGIAAAAIAGLAVGAIVAGSSANRRYERDYYYAPPPPPRYYAPPVAYYAPQPWSPAWYDYCSRKYVSFDPRSGTYQPYYGPRRFCE